MFQAKLVELNCGMIAMAKATLSLQPRAKGGKKAITMILIEEQIHDWQKVTQSLRTQGADDCVTTFFAHLPPQQPPGAEEVARAAQRVQAKATLLLTGDSLLAMLPQPPANPRQREALRSSWQSLMQPWTFPTPAAEGHIAPWRLILAATVGSILGMLLLGELLEWLVNQREIGLLVGAVSGAAGWNMSNLASAFIFAILAISSRLSGISWKTNKSVLKINCLNRFKLLMRKIDG